MQRARIIFPDLEDAVQLQQYDKEVEEFIDCEEGDVIMPRAKIRVQNAKQTSDGKQREASTLR